MLQLLQLSRLSTHQMSRLLIQQMSCRQPRLALQFLSDIWQFLFCIHDGNLEYHGDRRMFSRILLDWIVLEWIVLDWMV